MRKFIYDSWNYIFDHDKSPLKNIPDITVRHMVLQMLAYMWVVAFAIFIGSLNGIVWSLLGHIALIAAVTVTVATYKVAEDNPESVVRLVGSLGRTQNGEHE
jgi:hypothetical protein